MRRNYSGSLRLNARRSGEASEEDRHIQIRVGDRSLLSLLVEEKHLFFILSEN